MATTYDVIASTIVSTPISTITFNNIPNNYTDLRLSVRFKSGSATGLSCRINLDSAQNYSGTRLYAWTSGIETIRTDFGTSHNLTMGADSSANYSTFVQADFLSYSGTNRKTILAYSGIIIASSAQTSRGVLLWNSTDAINRLDIFPSGTTFSTGSIATLYGIRKA